MWPCLDFGVSYWRRMQTRCEGVALRARNAQAAPTIPEACTCPITGDWIADPVRSKYGYVYERAAILRHLQQFGRDPMTNLPLDETQLSDDLAVPQ